MKVFISYSRLDASETANTIHTYLKDSGHEVFIDTSNIRGGDEWRNTIEKNISDSDIFVLIVSRSAYRRPEVKKELELADNMKKRIIPCVNKRYVNYENLPDNIKKYNGINFERLDDLIQELDYKIEVETKEQGITSIEVKTETNKEEKNYSPILEKKSTAKTISVQEYLEKAKVFQRLKQYQRALKNYDEAIKLDNDNFEAHFNKAQLLYNIEDYTNSLDTIEKAIDIQPEHLDVWYHKGIILEKLERYEEAIEAFDTDLYIDDQDVKSWTSKANVLLRLEWYEEAIECYNKILNNDPQNSDALNKRKIAHEQIDAKLVKQNKDKEISNELNEGNSFFEQGKYQEAINCFDKVLNINPDHDTAQAKKKLALEHLSEEKNNYELNEENNEIYSGPTISWYEMKNKKVKSVDKEIMGKIEKITQNHIRIKEGHFEKFWLPKFLADIYDGEFLWLDLKKEEIRQRYYYDQEPAESQYDLDRSEYNFKYGKNKSASSNDKIRLGKKYFNIRDLK